MEFIIRRTDGDYFDLPYSLFAKTLHPNSVPYSIIQDAKSHSIEVLGCPILFRDEMVGIQVVFGNSNISEEVAQQLVEEALQNVQDITGQHGEVIQTV